MAGTAVTADDQAVFYFRHLRPEEIHIPQTSAADYDDVLMHNYSKHKSHTLSPEKDMA
jgi:hypothetical protein